MRPYEGLNEQDWKIVQIALQKLPITGVEAPMMSNLLQKVQMEIELQSIPKEDRPKKGDLITKE
jgi:hypothetical protein